MEAFPVGLRGLSGLALSGALHALLAVTVPGAPALATRPVPPSSAEVSLETLPPEPETTPPPPVAPQVEDQPPPPTRHRPVPPAPAPPPPPTIAPSPAPPAPSTPSTPSPARRSTTSSLSLDPHAVAMSGFSPLPAPTVVDAAAVDRGSRQAAAALDEHLSLANQVPGERRRPPPHLQRRSDGGFVWRGPGINARIGPDGEVTFSDHPGFSFDGENPGAPALPRLSFRFDITDRLERGHGNDPYYADRRWFMDETSELRQRLAARADGVRDTHEDRSLLGHLRRIAQDESLDLRQRHRAVYRIWRDCSDDDPGQRARALVLRFVHDELPEAGAEAFTRQELDALNAGSGPRFAPYDALRPRSELPRWRLGAQRRRPDARLGPRIVATSARLVYHRLRPERAGGVRDEHS